MSILDDAIREHLDLKRAHGADDAELKRLEDEAFGPPARPEEPDPLAEAPTEFMSAPGTEAAEGGGEAPGGRRVPNIADLQEPPDSPPPAEEAEPESAPSHSTEERHAIAEQPTEHFDVEGTYEDAATESEGPSDEDLVDAEVAGPRLAPVDPVAGIDGGATAEPASADQPAPDDEQEPEDEFDEFFSEQRLSDELNQALEAPLPDEPGAPATDEAPAVIEIDEVEIDDEVEVEIEEEGEQDEGEEYVEDGDEDVLEKTPDFLEDAPEDDDLWFEQKPPKDFDFDD